MLRGGERPRAHLGNVGAHGVAGDLADLGIALDELWRDPLLEPENVVDDEHLAVALGARAG